MRNDISNIYEIVYHYVVYIYTIIKIVNDIIFLYMNTLPFYCIILYCK